MHVDRAPQRQVQIVGVEDRDRQRQNLGVGVDDHRPKILVGVTHPQTCLVLSARLRTLREAGFRVLLVSGPGELLDQTSAREEIGRAHV